MALSLKQRLDLPHFFAAQCVVAVDMPFVWICG